MNVSEHARSPLTTQINAVQGSDFRDLCHFNSISFSADRKAGRWQDGSRVSGTVEEGKASVAIPEGQTDVATEAHVPT